MPALHEGHDMDLTHETECERCREVVRSPEHHRCVVIYPPDCCMEDQ